MAKDKILSDIKEAEQSAAKKVEAGLKEKEDKIASARAEARKIIKEAELDAEKSANNALKSAQDELHKEHDEIVNKGKRDAEGLISNAESNVDKAASMLVEEFERTIYA